MGGNERESDTFIDIDSSGYIYLAGTTSSTDFPTTDGAFCEESNGRSDVFVTKLSPDGGTIVFSTLLGGSEMDECDGMMVDGSGHVYVVGHTYSDDLPTTPGAYCRRFSGGTIDVFLAKFTPSGSMLEYSTFLGGENTDYASDIFVDDSGNAYVIGDSRSEMFPTTEGAYCRTKGQYRDCYVTKVGPGGGNLVYSTYIGGSDYDNGEAIWVGDDGNAFIAGYTRSIDFPITSDASDSKRNGDKEGFITRLAPDGKDLEYSSFIGGDRNDFVNDIALDDTGAIYLAGRTNSDDFPTTDGAYYPDPDDLYSRARDIGFVTKMTPNGTSLVFSTYIQDVPGRYDTYPTVLYVNGPGDVLLGGYTASYSLPTTSEAYDTKYNGEGDTFVMWLASNGSRIHYSSYLGGQEGESLTGTHLTSSGDVLLAGSTASLDFPTTSDALDTTMGGNADAFLARLRMVRTSGMPPLPPQNLTVEYTGIKIVVRWDPPPEPEGHRVTGYRVYKGPPDNRTYVRFLHKDNVEFFDLEVEIGVTYHYTIVAVNAIGPSMPATVSEIPWTRPWPPKNLTATSRIESVVLNWSLPINAGGLPILGYHIFRGETSVKLDQISGVGNQTTFIDYNVSKDRVYYYMIQAFHAKARGLDSKVVSVMPFGVPGPPANLKATSGDSTIFLDWDYPFSDGGREVKAFFVYGCEMDGALERIATIDPFERRFTHLHLVNGRDYFYMVTAWNSAGEGPGTDLVRGRPRGPPGPPVGLFAIPGYKKVELTWRPPNLDGGSWVTSYMVWAGTDPDRLSFERTVHWDTTYYKHTDLENGRTFYYAVQAVNPHGYGELSTVIKAIPFGPPTTPMRIDIKPGIDQLVLNWTPPKDDGGYPVTAYEIYRGTSKQAVRSLIVVDGDVTSYVDSDVKVGVIYYYRMIVLTAKASSKPSWVVVGSPLGAPTIPQGITLIPGINRVLISWGTPVHDGGFLLAGYNIYMRYEGLEEDWRLLATVHEGTNHMEKGLTNGRSYELMVTAFNDIREGPGITAKVTIVGSPEPPSDLTAVVVDGVVLVNWGPPVADGGSPVTVYSVKRVDPVGVTYILAHVRDGTTYIDQFAEPGAEYFYTVIASNELGDSEPARSLKVRLPESGADPEVRSGTISGLTIIVVAAMVVTAGYLWYRKKWVRRG